MLYWLIILLGFVIIGLTKISIRFDDNKKMILSGKKIYMIIISIVLVFFAAMRSTKVGADTKMYETLFNYVRESDNIQSIYYSWKMGKVEIGYFLLEYLISRVFSYQIFLFITSIISIVPVMLSIYRHSKNYWLSVFLYISLGYYSFMMNGIRQSIAIGICFLAFEFAQKKKLLQFLICMVLAVLFHTSAILFLPIYWLDIIKQRRLYIYLYLFLIVSMFLIREPLFVLINSFARQSFGIASVNQGGYGMFILMLFTSFIGWIYYTRFLKKQKEFSKINWQYLLMISIPGIMWPLANLNAELNRMTYYYFIFIILYLPSLLQVLRKNERLIIGGSFMMIASYYLYAYIINGQLLYDPYYFYWN